MLKKNTIWSRWREVWGKGVRIEDALSVVLKKKIAGIVLSFFSPLQSNIVVQPNYQAGRILHVLSQSILFSD